MDFPVSPFHTTMAVSAGLSGFGIVAGCSSSTFFCPLPISVLLWALFILIAVTCIGLDSYPFINSQFSMFILLFQWSQDYPVSRKQLLFILWILPILPYFRIIFILVIFHWVDALIKMILKLLLHHSNPHSNTTIYVVSLYVPGGYKTWTNCNVLAVRITKCRRKTLMWDQSKSLGTEFEQQASEKPRAKEAAQSSPCYKPCASLSSLQLSDFRFLKVAWEFRHPNTIQMNRVSVPFGLVVPSWCDLW